MFDTLKSKLADVFDGLARRGALSESDVDAALREVRLALLDADVALPAVKAFTQKVREQAVGVASMRAVRPDQQVIKIVHDALIEMLGGDAESLNISTNPPSVILWPAYKVPAKQRRQANWPCAFGHDRKKVMLASLDITRPAAREQLRMLGGQAEVGVLNEVDGESPAQIAKRALQAAKLQAYDVLIFDTAGRLSINEALMAELRDIKKLTKPHETFSRRLNDWSGCGEYSRGLSQGGWLTGIALTRLDGDARGGAALSMRHVTGCPIKLAGVGEKQDALEDFDPARLAGRILDMGDVVALVEKATEAIEVEEAKDWPNVWRRASST